MKSCLLITLTFISNYQHTHEPGWVFYNFENKFLVHTWAQKEREIIKFLVSSDNKLQPVEGAKILSKGMCQENGLPYTYYEIGIKK